MAALTRKGAYPQSQLMLKGHNRIVYSFFSAFLKVVIFLVTVVAAYKVNSVGGPILGYWVTVLFACVAIFGAKAGVEAVDSALRERFGWLPD